MALQYIRELRTDRLTTNWSIPDEYAAKAFEIAEIARASPATAVVEAKSYIEGLHTRNAKRQVELQKARKLRRDLIAQEEERDPQHKKKASAPATARQRRAFGLALTGFVGRFVNGGSDDSQVTETRERVDDAVTVDVLSSAEQNGAVRYQAGELEEPKQTAAEVALQRSASNKSTPKPAAINAPSTNRGCLGRLLFWRPAPMALPAPDPTDHGLHLPLTNAGSRGLKGLVQRWLLTTLNATPTSGLNWMEVTKDGLQIYQPLATVSQRTIKFRQVRDGQVVISVNPPAYFDALLGMLRQFRSNVDTPWGELVLYEGGGARVIASAIALAPGAKLKEIRTALELLHLAENEHEGFRRIPQIHDLFIYVDPDMLAGEPTDRN